MQSFNFEPLIDKPTRVSHIIDHIWTNYFDFPYESGVLECDITDHHIIVSSFQVETISKTITKKFRDHSVVLVEKLKLELFKIYLCGMTHYFLFWDKIEPRVLKMNFTVSTDNSYHFYRRFFFCQVKGRPFRQI